MNHESLVTCDPQVSQQVKGQQCPSQLVDFPHPALLMNYAELKIGLEIEASLE